MNNELLNTYTFFVQLAVTYNCDAYGANSYNSNEPCTTTSGSGDGSSGGSLVDTGVNVVLPIVIGLVLIIGPALYFIRRRLSKKQQQN